MSVTQAENSILPNAPAYKQSGLKSESEVLDSLDDYAHKLSQWAGDIVTWQMDLQGAIERGWLINDARVISLTANKITAGTIGVGLNVGGPSLVLDGGLQRITIGSNSNLIADGLVPNIRIYDNQTPQQLRGIWGSMGATSNVLYFNGTSTTVNLGNPSALTEDIYALDIQFKLETLPSAEAHDYRIWYKLGKLEAYIEDGDNILKLWDHSASALRSTGQVMVVDKWYHMLIFFNNATTNGEVWLDGELVLENFSYNDTTDANTLYIGSNGSSKFFKGWIREARYWGCNSNPTAMVASEVKSLDVQTLPSTVRPTNLVTLRHEWQLDEGTGTSANDTGDTGGQTGTITGGAWQVLDDNYGFRMMDKDGQVFFHISDKTYINGVALINASVGDGAISELSATKVTGQIVDAQIANIEWAKIDNAAIVDADIVNLSASKINAGTLNAAIVSVINLTASNINAGTLTVDGSPAISVVGSGAMVFQSGGDIVMKANATDFNYIFWQTSAGTQKGVLGLAGSGAYIQLASSNSAGIWLDTDNELLFTTNSSTGNIRIRGHTLLADNTSSWVAMQSRTTNPTSPVAGTFYFNSSDDTIRVYNGTAWRKASTAAA